MAKDDGFRDMTDTDDKPYRTKSSAQLDLERRLENSNESESRVGKTVKVNPNPFGADDYAGTDPIYQNYANETEKPLRAEGGAFGDAEEEVRKLHDLGDLDEKQVAEDAGMGGKARVSEAGTPAADRYLVPGQEGYPDDPEKYSGPTVRESTVREREGADKDGEEDDKGKVQTANNPGTNMGASTRPPAPPKSTGDKTGNRSGDRSEK